MTGPRSSSMTLPTSRAPLRAIVFTLSALSLLLLVSACARTQPILNIEEEPVITGSGEMPSLLKVRGAIFTACRDKGWLINPREDGHIIATAHVRRHAAIVDISYTPAAYSITYRDSKVLLYDGQMIHRNYNKWVQLLSERIKLELNKL